MINPTVYTCSNKCGARVMSHLNGEPLMRHDRTQGRLVEQKCTCGGTYKAAGPLDVVGFSDLTRLQIHCKSCKVAFKRITPSRFSCSGCSEVALVHEKSLFLFPGVSRKVTIDYKTV